MGISRMVRKELKHLVKVISGEKGLEIIKHIKTKDHISEFVIAEKVNLEINKTRNILYKLFHYNLVSFIRKKDKTKGWYVYYWILNKDNIHYVIEKYLRERISHLTEQIERERNDIFFICPHKCMRLNFDKATEFNYQCPECGELLSEDDKKERVEKMEKEVNDLRVRHHHINELITDLRAKKITIRGAVAAKAKNIKRIKKKVKNSNKTSKNKAKRCRKKSVKKRTIKKKRHKR